MTSKPVPNGVEHFGHATRAGHTDDQHEEHFEYDFSAAGAFPHPPKFGGDKKQEREYVKGRLAMAYRLFAKWGFDEGVAGHISMRVSSAIRPIDERVALTSMRILSSQRLSGLIRSGRHSLS